MLIEYTEMCYQILYALIIQIPKKCVGYFIDYKNEMDIRFPSMKSNRVLNSLYYMTGQISKVRCTIGSFASLAFILITSPSKHIRQFYFLKCKVLFISLFFYSNRSNHPHLYRQGLVKSWCWMQLFSLFFLQYRKLGPLLLTWFNFNPSADK